MARVSRETQQKELMRAEMKKFTTFFSSEELYEKLKHKNVSIATIYRFLKELRNKKELHVYICKRQMIYSSHEKNHSHFICEKCKKIRHVELEKIDFLKNNVKGKICHFQIDVYGACEECLAKER